MLRIVSFFIFLLAFIKVTSQLRLTSLRVPSHAAVDGIATLQCHYSLDGDLLYTLKWYKDGREFYRYSPREQPPIQVFQLDGVHVDVSLSGIEQITLNSITKATTGRYDCEVSGEAPLFQTVTGSAKMEVLAVPKNGPKIIGGKAKYRIGELADLNCTISKTKPSAKLTWYINDIEANKDIITGPWVWMSEKDHTRTIQVNIKFKILPQHFKDGEIVFKCLASISNVYENYQERRAIDIDTLIQQHTTSHTISPAYYEKSMNSSCNTILSQCTFMIIYFIYICILYIILLPINNMD